MDVTSKDKNNLPLFPGLLPYGHTASAPAFRPTETGALIAKSAKAMNEQVDLQKKQIIEQAETLKRQYIELEERRVLSNLIYEAKCGFKTDAGGVYHLYSRVDGSMFLSLISPNEWRVSDLSFVATVKQLYDMTWQPLVTTESLHAMITI